MMDDVEFEKYRRAKIAMTWLMTGIDIGRSYSASEKIFKNSLDILTRIQNQIIFDIWSGLEIWDIILRDGPVFSL